MQIYPKSHFYKVELVLKTTF